MGENMRQYEIAMLVRSISGHDQGKFYVIMDMKEEYLFLMDGIYKKMSNPKKKKKKHVQRTETIFPEIAERIKNNALKDEYVKRQIKLYNKQKT